MLDADIIIADRAPSIFELGIKEVGMVQETANVGWYREPKKSNWLKKCKELRLNLVPSTTYPQLPYRMCNAGVIYMTKAARQKARKLFMSSQEWYDHPTESESERKDQGYWNSQLSHHKFNVTELDPRWNVIKPLHNSIKDPYFKHYSSRASKSKISSEAGKI